MKYGIVIKLLMVACVSIVQLTGCSSDAEEMEKAIPDVPIRICLLYTSDAADEL